MLRYEQERQTSRTMLSWKLLPYIEYEVLVT